MSDTISDIVTSGLDQHLPTQEAENSLLQRVDNIIQKSIEAGDLSMADDAMQSLLGINRVSGLATAKFIYTMKHGWKYFNQEDSFENHAWETWGISKATQKKGCRAWEFLISDDIPKEYLEKIKLQGIKSIIPMSNLWAQKWEVEPHQWLALSNAPDVATVNKLIRQIKNVEPKANSIQMEWDADEKSIIVWKNGTPHPIHLMFKEGDDVISAGLDRILKSSGILEKE